MNKITQDMRFKQAVIEYSLKHGVTAAAIRYKTTRQNIYRWRKKNDGTIRSLADRSHRPYSHPNQHTEAEIKLVQDMGRRNPHAGLVVFWVKLRQRGYTRSISGLYKLLRRIDGKPIKLPNPKYIPKPYEKMEYPGQRGQIDVKYVPSACLVGEAAGEKFYQYTFIDEYSRFRYLEAFKEQSTYSSTQFLKHVVEKFPYAIACIQTDNGFEFTNEMGNSKNKPLTLFEKTLVKLGIRHKKIKPFTPRHNGKVERSHRKDNEEFYREIQVNLAYRWFLGYGQLDTIPHFATVSYAFCKRFPEELTAEIFEHILNKALNNRMLDPSAVFIDGTHIKASANKKKFQKEQVAKAAKVYSGQLRREVNAEREKLGKKPIEDEDDNDKNSPQGGGGSQDTVEKTVSTTDPDCGMFVKGEHERQFAYEAHTACDKRGFVLGVEVTAGNVHDSVAWDKVYDDVTRKFDVQFVVMDAGYKTPWIAKKTLDDGKIPVLPYTKYKGRKDGYRPWDYKYDPVKDVFTCPHGEELRHTTTDRDGKRIYRSTPKNCVNCPSKAYCGANEKGQKLLTTHIWQEYLDIVEGIRKTEMGKQIYAQRKETIERVFADAKEKHAMRYTHHRGLAAVTRWVRLKYAAMNLKKLAQWSWRNSFSSFVITIFVPRNAKPQFLPNKNWGSLTD